MRDTIVLWKALYVVFGMMLWLEDGYAFCGGFDLVSRKINRKVFPLGPWFKKILVVGAFWVS